METKSILQSKTFWVNVLAAVALFAQNQYGFAISPETQAYALVVVNLLLRLVTRQGVSLL